MRNISFKRKESVLRTLDIQKDARSKKPVNWDRIIYLVILFFALFFFGRYMINTYFFIEADGHVLFDTVNIRNTDDCRIIDFYVKEGDEVKAGDSLFSYIPDSEARNGAGAVNGANSAYGTKEFAMQVTKPSDLSWAEKEIFKTQEEVLLQQLQYREYTNLVTLYKKELKRIENEVMLDALPRNRLDDQLDKINALEIQLQITKGKIGAYQSSLAQLEGMKKNLDASTNVLSKGTGVAVSAGGVGSGGGNNGGRKVFYCPLDGTVTDVRKNEFEVALKTEDILAIHKPNNVYIKSFFQQEDLKSLKKGDQVKITFPDGTKSIGRIERFYLATYRLPEEFQKKYEPTTRSLSADVYPLTREDLMRWRMYYKMGVKISKTKY
jgi:multidrug resistance efflux pump